MPTHHYGYFCSRNCVLALDGVGIEDNAEGALRVLSIWDGSRDQVAKTLFWEEVRGGVVEVDYHYCYGGGER